MSQAAQRVLLVEDDPDHAHFVKLSLKRSESISFEVEHAERLEDALKYLKGGQFDIVLLDLGLPDSSGVESIRRIGREYPSIPIVVLTANADPSVGLEATANGAQDYFYKGDINTRELERSLRYAVGRQRLLQELKHTNESLDQRNRRVTELYNTAQQFIDNASHEFRTPLTVIKEYVTMVRDGLVGPVTDRQCDFLDIANDRTDDLTVMINDMLDVSRWKAGMLGVWRQCVSVDSIIKRVLPSLTRKAAMKNVHLCVAIEEGTPEVYCDPEQIGRVIVNLAVNAIKFVGDRGSVTLRAEKNPDTAEVVLAVVDNGPGIAPDDLKLIFERFRQGKASTKSSVKGFGLGLNIARDLVRLNLGSINVQSEGGQGSTFSFGVPTWDPVELASRYLSLVEESGHEALWVTMATARVDQADADETQAFDSVLQHAFRGSDLVMQVAPREWVVLAECAARDVDQMFKGVQTIWAKAAGGRPARKFPELRLESHGSWRLPGQTDQVFAQLRNLLKETEPSSSRTILLVDDDREILRSLEIRLNLAGYDTITANDGLTAINLAVAERPDAVLLDNLMPGMKGVEVVERLGQMSDAADIPIIMLSASLQCQQEALNRGVRFFFQKPCDSQSLVEALEQVISE